MTIAVSSTTICDPLARNASRECLSRVGDRALPDDGWRVARAVTVVAVLGRFALADVERQLAEREHVTGGNASVLDALAVDERPVARAEVVELDA